LKYFFLTVLIIFVSCGSKDEPDNLIDQSKMVKTLTEIHLLEAKIKAIKIYPYDSIQVIYDHYESLLFENLEISKEQYEESFNYYLENPNKFEKIYNIVVDSLLQKEKTSNR